MRGFIQVMAVGKGHEDVELPDDPAEAKKKVTDLMTRGYLISVKHEGKDLKVTGYDETKNEYIAQDNQEVRVSAASVKAQATPPAAGG